MVEVDFYLTRITKKLNTTLLFIMSMIDLEKLMSEEECINGVIGGDDYWGEINRNLLPGVERIRPAYLSSVWPPDITEDKPDGVVRPFGVNVTFSNELDRQGLIESAERLGYSVGKASRLDPNQVRVYETENLPGGGTITESVCNIDSRASVTFIPYDGGRIHKTKILMEYLQHLTLQPASAL